MSVFSPLAVAALVVAAVSLIGIIVNTVKRSRTFAGYEEIAADSARIAASLAGSESFRDGHDLLVSGNRDGIPLVVRFSNSEASPGLNIRCGAPVDFLLTFSAEGDPHPVGHLLRSGNRSSGQQVHDQNRRSYTGEAVSFVGRNSEADRQLVRLE